MGGGLPGPPFRHLTIERPRHEGLDARIADLVAPTIEHMGYELVRVQISGKEKPTVQIMADRMDGAAFTVEDCTEISHAVGAVLDVADSCRGCRADRDLGLRLRGQPAAALANWPPRR